MCDTPIARNEDAAPILPRAHFAGTISVISTLEELENAYAELKKANVLGFDTETRPTFTKGHADLFVAIVQFATDNHAWIIRTSILKLPSKLREILEDPKITKVGFSTHDDIKRLQRYHPLVPANLIDLQLLAKKAKLTELSLKKLSERFLHVSVSKSARLSNWEAEELTPKQLDYAATDAWLCYQLYYTSNLISPTPLNDENR